MTSWFQKFRARQELKNRELAREKGFADGRTLQEATARRDWLWAAHEVAIRSENRARAEEIEPELLKAADEAARLYAVEAEENLRILELIRKLRQEK
jgi:hypothetical protein